jgi:hypothetical protein
MLKIGMGDLPAPFRGGVFMFTPDNNQGLEYKNMSRLSLLCDEIAPNLSF